MKYKHGKTETRLFNIWRGILTRCTNKNRKDFKYYGGKGITVCDDWKNDFQSFYDWSMSHGYADNLTIDRIDVNGNYCPENCRWLLMSDQCINKSNNRIVSAFGQSLTLSQWSQKTGMKISTIKSRLDKLGWGAEKALSIKPNYKVRILKKSN